MNTLFSPAMSEDNGLHLEALAAEVAPELPLDKTNQDYWVAYGSIVVNALQPDSDIDLLYVVRGGEEKPFRHQAYFRDRPVTVYAVSEATLQDDGERFLYGGYFSGKLLSPHVLVADTDDDSKRANELIQKTVGDFVANFLDLEVDKTYSQQEIASEVLRSYLDLCPWYKTYLIKFFSSPAGSSLFQSLPQHYASSLLTARVIEPVSGGYTPADGAPVVEHDTRNENKIRAIARFWSYGAIEHGNNHLFADYYFDKAEQNAKKIDGNGEIWQNIRQHFKLGITTRH